MTRAALLAAALALAAHARADDPPAPPPKGAFLKMRVEVETRDVLKVTDKSVVLLTRYPYYEPGTNAEKVAPTPEGVPAFRVELDFARAKEFRELATVLNGRDVVVTGMSELRNVLPPPRPPGPGGFGFTGGQAGGFGFPPSPQPTWQLHPSLRVMTIRPVAEKR